MNKNEDRNEELVRKRIKDPRYWTWGKLQIHFKISRPTALEIFERDVRLYATKGEIEEYREYLKSLKKGVRRVIHN